MLAERETVISMGTEIMMVEQSLDRRLLVFDTDAAFLERTQKIGEALGFMVETTSTLRDFARCYEDFAPSVIVYRFFSPDMDGFELVNWLYERKSNAHVLLTSERDSFFLNAVRELASVKGHMDVDVIVEPPHMSDFSNQLTRRLATMGANPRDC